MIKKLSYTFGLLAAILLISCSKSESPYVEFETTAGTFTVQLYKETPLHRDYIIGLVNDGYYDGLLFHKAISGMYTETGDPKSKTASRNRILGQFIDNEPIASEINYPASFHKKGALSASRLPDSENQTKTSIGGMFRIIQGRKYAAADLDTIELSFYNKKLNSIWQQLAAKHRTYISTVNKNDDTKYRQAIEDSLTKEAEKLMEKEDIFLFTKEQRAAYTTQGGCPEYDNEYTVFGEVVEGLDLIDKICNQKTDINARPLEDVKIIKARVVKR